MFLRFWNNKVYFTQMEKARWNDNFSMENRKMCGMGQHTVTPLSLVTYIPHQIFLEKWQNG